MADVRNSTRDVVRWLYDDKLWHWEHVVYDSYGNIAVSWAADPYYGVLYATAYLNWTNYGYTGEERDAWSGYYRMDQRWYDPIVASWITQDPIGFAGGQSNLYVYVGNSPTNYTDPTGLAGIGDWMPRWTGIGMIYNTGSDVISGRTNWYDYGAIRIPIAEGRIAGTVGYHALQGDAEQAAKHASGAALASANRLINSGLPARFLEDQFGSPLKDQARRLSPETAPEADIGTESRWKP
ncbi:MAG: RHS repeat-associated core domain-containing protein [Pirellulales bacterium]